MRTVTSEKELGNALKNHEEEIRVEGDLAAKTFVIHATGKAAWIVASGCLVIAIAAGIAMLVPDPAEPIEVAATAMGLGGAVTSFVAPTAIAVTTAPALMAGISAPGVAVAALSIGIAGGGIGVLNNLRGYRLNRVDGVKKTIILTRK